jgi:pyruvate/2-oxoglutarate dehydrogenase complex dihydrolipoamide acyltransferase (E2) component
MSLHEVILPDLGIEDQPISVSSWLVRKGAQVSEGEPVVEVLCGCATVDLPAGVTGVLIEKRAAEDEAVRIGQTLGIIETRD